MSSQIDLETLRRDHELLDALSLLLKPVLCAPSMGVLYLCASFIVHLRTSCAARLSITFVTQLYFMIVSGDNNLQTSLVSFHTYHISRMPQQIVIGL